MNLTNWLSSPAAEALGWTLIHALWQGFVLVLAVAFLFHWLRRGRASLRYQVGIGGLIGQLLVSVLTFGWYYQSTAAAATAPTSSLLAGMAVSFGSPHPESWTNTLQTFLASHLTEVVWLWMAGVAVFGLRLIGGWVYIQRLRASAVQPVPALLADAASRIGQKMNSSVRLQLSAHVNGPMVVGLLKPVVLWPVGLLAGLSLADVEAILAHELAHVRRYDYALNVLQSVVEVLYFFHPALWWLSARVREEREHCCDDIALDLIGSPPVLARALARVEEWQRSVHEAPVLAMAFASKRQLLLQRVRRMLGVPTRPLVSNTHLAGLTLVTLLLLSVSVYAVQRVEQPETAAEKTLVQLTRKRFLLHQTLDSLYALAETKTPVIQPALLTNTSDSTPLPQTPAISGELPAPVNTNVDVAISANAQVSIPDATGRQDTTRLRAAQKELEVLTKRLQEVMAERQPAIERLSKEIAELTLQNGDWQKQTLQMEKQHQDMARQQAMMARQQVAMARQQSELAKKIAPLDAEMEKLSRQRTAQAKDLMRQKEAQRQRFEKEMDRLGDQMDKLGSKMGDMGKQLEPLNSKLQPYHDRLSVLADSISRLVEPTQELSEKIGELSGQIADEANVQAEKAMEMAEEALRAMELNEDRPARAPRAPRPARVSRPSSVPVPPAPATAPTPAPPAVRPGRIPRVSAPRPKTVPSPAQAPKPVAAPKAPRVDE